MCLKLFDPSVGSPRSKFRQNCHFSVLVPRTSPLPATSVREKSVCPTASLYIVSDYTTFYQLQICQKPRGPPVS